MGLGAPHGTGSGLGVTPSVWVHSPALLSPPRPVRPAWLLLSHSQDNDAPAPESRCEKSCLYSCSERQK